MPLRSILASCVVALSALPAFADGASTIPPESTFMRTAHAARRTGPIQLDGRMDEPAWQAAPLEENFTQARPDEGQPSTVHTAFRVLWDDEYLYFGAICDDPLPPTATLTRRDRFTEGDSVQFDLDTTFDRRTAYHFQVFAAGQQLDALHYNDTSFTTDWDAAWESAVARTPTGWSVEMKIPLRVMRIPEQVSRMGFNVYRILTRRKEEAQWRYRPNGRPGDISRLGVLDGLDGMHPVRALELRPYVATRISRNAPSPSGAVPRGQFGTCSSTGIDVLHQAAACLGLDLRLNVASDLALVGTINPDFGQVEADQRVLNLSTFETRFPEKRPFFLEGLDLFKPAVRVDFGGPYGGDAYQIFYSRRIGRGAPPPPLDADQKLVYQQPTVPVVSAAKISGTVAGASVGVISAIESSLDAQVQQPDGSISNLRAVEARSDAAMRVQKELAGHGVAGVTATSTDPFGTAPNLALPSRHARVGEGDLTLYTSDRAVNFTVQGAGSLLSGNTPTTLRDGTTLGETAHGGAVSTRLSWERESFFLMSNTDYLSRAFSVNDLGFMRRANLARAVAGGGIRNPHPTSLTQQWQVVSLVREVRDAALAHRLERDGIVELSFTTNSFWFVDVGGIYQAPYVDDRELQDGTPLERQPAFQTFTYAETDPRRRVQLTGYWNHGRATGPRFERSNEIGGSVIFRPVPRLDGSLDLSYGEYAGTIRAVRAATALPGSGEDPSVVLDPALSTSRTRLYLLAEQHSRALSATARATWAFTPRMTLQAYAQLFTAGIAYGSPLQAVAAPGRPTITLAGLAPADPATLPPTDIDERQVGLNVNLIFRWEWRTGSTLYFVYAHQSANDFTFRTGRGLDLRGELSGLGASGVAHGDTLLFKMDLLTAL